MSDIIFQIIDLSTETEYYSFTQPVIDKTILLFENLIKKNSVMEQVLNDEVIEEFYSEPVSFPDDTFKLQNGLIIKTFDTKDLKWLNVSESKAKEALKDKALIYYQTVMPKILNDFKTLKAQIDELRTQKNTQKPQKNLYLE